MKSYKEFLNESKNDNLAVKMVKKALKDLGEKPSGLNIHNQTYANAIENISIMLADGDKRKAQQEADAAAETIAAKHSHLSEDTDRDHKYNSIAKIKKVLGKGQPSVDKIKEFIKKEYDMNNSDHQDIVSDIMGYYHLDPDDFFDNDGNILEAKAPITPEEVAAFLIGKFPNGPKATYDIGVNDTDGEYDVFFEYDCVTKKGFVNAKDTLFIEIAEDGFISFYNNFGTNRYPKTAAKLVKEIKSIIAQDKKDITY